MLSPAGAPRHDMRDPRKLRRRAGISGDPRKDQYFLEDARVLERIAGYAVELDVALDPVLEVGPGTGALTAHLLDRGERVVAIERDRKLAAFLRREFADAVSAGRLTVVTGDVLEVDLPTFSASVSNLPYGIASEILFRLLPAGRPLLVLVQREFGERMAARPGTAEYGRLSVTVQHYGAVSIAETVPPGAFTPSPPVESAVVRVLPRDPEYELADEEVFFRVVRALFTQRRKTVKNAIANTTHISGIEDVDRLLGTLGDETTSARPGTLQPRDFAAIANAAART